MSNCSSKYFVTLTNCNVSPFFISGMAMTSRRRSRCNADHGPFATDRFRIHRSRIATSLRLFICKMSVRGDMGAGGRQVSRSAGRQVE